VANDFSDWGMEFESFIADRTENKGPWKDSKRVERVTKIIGYLREIHRAGPSQIETGLKNFSGKEKEKIGLRGTAQ